MVSVPESRAMYVYASIYISNIFPLFPFFGSIRQGLMPRYLGVECYLKDFQ